MAEKIDHVEIKGVTYDVPGADGSVSSVNGKTGTVVLDAEDVGALPDNTSIPSKTSDLTNDSGFITSASVPTKTSDLTNDSGYITSSSVPTKTSDLTNDSGFITTETDPTVPSWAKASTKPTYTAQEVGALPSSTSIPSKTSDLTNDSNFITAAQAPVTSVNGETGAVTLDATDVGALPDNTTIPSDTSDLTNGAGFITSSDIPADVSDFNNDAGYITENDVDGTYLPLTAEADYPITGRLFLENEYGRARINIGTAGGITAAAIDENNDGTAGMHCFNSTNGTVANLYASGTEGKIRLRPRGVNSTTGQVEILPTGQITGGHPLLNNSNTSASKSISSSSSSYTNLSSLTNLEEGVYLFVGKCSFTPSAVTSATLTLAISTTNNSSQQSYSSSVPTTTTTLKHLNVCMLVSVSSTTMYLNFQSNGVAGTVGNYYFRAVRLS